ncbi:hypothetical protein LEP1GSC016_3674 [Leptospira borgpetersenii serovar Hardjo-bovis str. Sponselee]|uniref:Uncharacterized protein n=1 Tax=Leptospira borgpetersenii serovar Hardjo-bovis str. Sponselee TaxID=1303729 RepID=M6BLU6_LEPBO|nr:hypothetical protein LBK6_14610 [Leptospira borgpetersenii serovar Hardjo]EMJ80717.1 hypothetical protein LEP1GSC016_3674 [Leptospira borgpetersenii serovar Hardjo-bovis str. Sponselee]AMX62732.1 hypothetical protein LBK9_14530 [Leptospira borgpetersenii serovar Hardjo]AMX65975.1 hypothetical protein LBK30_14540 [Leptospira borgpetersenii serovar Hardjo]AMX69208.1 hypothetical protein LBHA_14495 [Leptospira borgpetersenii serovar Hardjo]
MTLTIESEILKFRKFNDFGIKTFGNIGTYKKNIIISLFQKLKYYIFFKKPTILDSVRFYEDFSIFAKIAHSFWYHFHASE